MKRIDLHFQFYYRGMQNDLTVNFNRYIMIIVDYALSTLLLDRPLQ